MEKGNVPLLHILIVRNLLFFLVCTGSYAQTDTLLLKEFEVIEVGKKQHNEFTMFTFDSVQYANSSLDAGDFLNDQTGIFVKDYGPGSTSSLSYRGNSANHTKVYWDGISIDNVMLGQSDFSLISLDNQVNTSFLKGGHSISMSSGGFGGVLDVSTGSDKWEGLTAETGYSMGSFNSRKLPFNLFIGNGKWKLESYFSYVSSDNNYPYRDYLSGDEMKFRENSQFSRLQYLPKVSFKPNKYHEFSLAYWYTNSDRNVPSPIGTIHGDAEQRDVWNKSMFKYTYTKKKHLLSYSASLGIDKLDYMNTGLGINSKSIASSFRNLVDHAYSVNSKWSLVSQLRMDEIIVQSNNYDDSKKQLNISYYESISYHSKYHFIKGGIRIEGRDFGRLYYMPAIDVGIAPVKSAKDLWFFMAMNKNVRLPTFNELYWLNAGNENLKEEISNSAELGFSQKLNPNTGTNLSLQFNIFLSEINNMIVWSPSSNGIWMPQNLKSVQNKGSEIGLKYKLQVSHFMLYLNTGYAYTSSVIAQNDLLPENEGKQQIYIPKHKVNGNLTLEIKELFLNYNQIYIGETFINPENTVSLPFNSPADIEFGKKFKSAQSMIIMSLRINNLYNESYQYVAHQPMPMRNYMISIKIYFNKSIPKPN